jgi:hypothetical protein
MMVLLQEITYSYKNIIPLYKSVVRGRSAATNHQLPGKIYPNSNYLYWSPGTTTPGLPDNLQTVPGILFNAEFARCLIPFFMGIL